jgi:CRISPR type III-A-associated protein Csm2
MSMNQNRNLQNSRRNTEPSSSPALPPVYLNAGYFDDGGQIHPYLITTQAQAVAKALGDGGVTSTLLRSFFAMVRGIERNLDTNNSFPQARTELYALQPKAANVVGRAVSRGQREGERLEVFRQFMERNAALAVQSEVSFRRGFLPHFEYVVAYFKYYCPKK